MTTHADYAQRRLRRRPTIECGRVFQRHAKLVLAHPGGNIRMRLRVHIRVHPQRDGGNLAHGRCDLGEALQLRRRFHIKTANPGSKRRLQLRIRFRDTGKDHPRRVAARLQHPRQLAAGNNIKARAFIGEQAQNGEIRVRLHRKMQLQLARQPVRQIRTELPTDGVAVIDIKRRTKLGDQIHQRHPADTPLRIHPGQKLTHRPAPAPLARHHPANTAAPSARSLRTKPLQ